MWLLPAVITKDHKTEFTQLIVLVVIMPFMSEYMLLPALLPKDLKKRKRTMYFNPILSVSQKKEAYLYYPLFIKSFLSLPLPVMSSITIKSRVAYTNLIIG